MPFGQAQPHAAWPGRPLKVPAAHGEHVALLLAFENSEEVPSGHCVHAEAPALSEYVPEGHAKHAARVAEPLEGL